jgi:hypothetical protein
MAVSAVALDVGSAPPPPIVPAIGRRRRPGVVVLLLLLAGALFLAHGSRTLNAPFGDSHDGRNAAIWATGSKSLRQDGPVQSRVGTRHEHGGYADHPPLIYVETALAEVLGRATPASTRAPAWLGSLALLLLVTRLLVDRGLRPAAAGVAAILLATTQMFLVYGTMLDTPVTSLPFGAALLVVWERGRRGRHIRPWWAATLAVFAVLAGWQSLLLAALIACWAVVRMVRGSGDRRVNLAFAGGALAGGLLLLGWLVWAFGGTLSPLVDRFLFRTGHSTQRVGLDGADAATLRAGWALCGALGMVALAGVAVALRDRRTRGAMVLALAVTVPYPLVFKAGVVNHDYWNYWLLLPLAMGLGVCADAVLGYRESRSRWSAGFLVSMAALAAALTMSSWAVPRTAEARKLSGFGVKEATSAPQLGPGQTTSWYAGTVGSPASWLVLATGRPAVAVRGAAIDLLARLRPTDAVLVGEVRCQGSSDVRLYEFRPAASLADRPPVIESCWPDEPPQLRSRREAQGMGVAGV